MGTREWAKPQESLLKSQLKTIRQFLRQGEEPPSKAPARSMSQMAVVYGMLFSPSVHSMPLRSSIVPKNNSI